MNEETSLFKIPIGKRFIYGGIEFVKLKQEGDEDNDLLVICKIAGYPEDRHVYISDSAIVEHPTPSHP